jgi:hypothetical protein
MTLIAGQVPLISLPLCPHIIKYQNPISKLHIEKLAVAHLFKKYLYCNGTRWVIAMFTKFYPRILSSERVNTISITYNLILYSELCLCLPIGLTFKDLTTRILNIFSTIVMTAAGPANFSALDFVTRIPREQD